MNICIFGRLCMTVSVIWVLNSVYWLVSCVMKGVFVRSYELYIISINWDEAWKLKHKIGFNLVDNSILQRSCLVWRMYFFGLKHNLVLNR